jgi:carbon starvation protein
MISREPDALPIGYGSMLLESMVAIMAMIASCALQPGVYFAVNSPAGIVGRTAESAVATISGWGFPVTAAEMQTLAHGVGEITLFNRTGGAPSLALGMAKIFAGAGTGGALLGFWYHFAIMFEALFILTIIDAGTRVGRFMLQDLLGQFSKPFGRTSWMPGVIATSAIIVAAWGYFLVEGVRDPLGGINSLWPLFGIANQLLAAIALSVATTVLLKMHGARYMWITCGPLVWLVTVTFSAAWQKIWSPLPRVGFLAQADQLRSGPLAFNARLDAVVCGVFMLLVAIVLADSLRVWYGVLRGTRDSNVMETPFVPTRLSSEEA